MDKLKETINIQDQNHTMKKKRYNEYQIVNEIFILDVRTVKRRKLLSH